MRVPVRRFAVVLSVALLALAISSATAATPAPTGPRLAVVLSQPYPNLLTQIETVGPAGEAPLRLAGSSGERGIQPNGSRPAWSPDGSLLAFTSSFGERSPVPYVVDAAGGRPQLVSKETTGSDPIFTPDGKWLAYSAMRVVKGHFERSGSPLGRYGVIVDWSIRAVNVATGRHRQLTPWRRNLSLAPSSFSPDGTKLAALASDGRTLEAVVVDLGSGRVDVLAPSGQSPVYSPDGSQIAFVRTRYERSKRSRYGLPPGAVLPAASDLFVVPAAGGRPRKIAHVKGGLAAPSWDPSGWRIAFVRLEGVQPGSPVLDYGNSVATVNADGTCSTTVLTIERGTYSGTAWQPGAGREAGPIAC